MTYRVNFYDVDVTKIISIRKLWDLVLFNAAARQTPGLNYTTSIYNKHDSESRLIEIYMKSHNHRVHIYSSMMNAHVVFPKEIEQVLQSSVTSAYPWKLSIESLDTFMLIYSLLVICYAILYNNITEHIIAAKGPKCDEVVTVKHINNELLLYDGGYWFLMFLVIYVSIESTSYVSISLVSAWSALMYVSTLYAACIVVDIGGASRIICVVSWAITTLMTTFITNASLFNGSFILFVHIFNAITIYVQLSEVVTYGKFVNLRLWGVILCNLCTIVLYLNNVSYIDAHHDT